MTSTRKTQLALLDKILRLKQAAIYISFPETRHGIYRLKAAGNGEDVEMALIFNSKEFDKEQLSHQ